MRRAEREGKYLLLKVKVKKYTGICEIMGYYRKSSLNSISIMTEKIHKWQ